MTEDDIMARPLQPSVDYFPLKSNFFEDIKIKRLLVEHGTAGIAIYLYMLCQIYRDKGYYVELRDILLLEAASALGIDEDELRNAISSMLVFGLFDKEKYRLYGILTSRGVQERYLNIKQRSSVRIFEDYAVSERRAGGLSANGVIAAETPHYCNKNPD